MLKPGYKQTDLGVLPEEWEIYSLSELGELKNGINKSKEDFGHGYPFINLMDVFGISVINSNKKFGLINSSKGDRSAYSLKEGDVLFIRSSVKPEGVGLTALVTQDLPETVFSGFLIRFRSNEKLNSGYKTYCFADENFRKRVIESSTVSANTNINQDALRKLLIPVPPLGEQQSIAEALDAIGTLLTSQQQLLAKKRALKLATQQALLSGERRLPGFAEKWEEKSIAEISPRTVAGGTPSTTNPAYWGGNIKWMSSGELNFKLVRDVAGRITEEGFNNSSTQALPPLCVLIGLAGQGKTRGTAAVNLIELCTNQSIAAIFPSQRHDSFFLFYNLDSRYEELRELSSGDSGRGGLNLSIIGSMIVKLPPLEEQRAIANVLSDMDAEIEALAAQLAKTQALKQGMMQDLLTGTIRLRAGAGPSSPTPIV